MTTDLILFDLGEFGQLRYHLDSAGEPWFCCKDIAQALDYVNTNMADLFGHVPEQLKGRDLIPTPGGPQQMLTVNLYGLFFFLGRSDKPKALPYQMKVACEIMPSISKHGVYVAPEAEMAPEALLKALSSPKGAILMLTRLDDEMEKNAKLTQLIEYKDQTIETQTAKIEHDKPIVEWAEGFESTGATTSVGDLARAISKLGYPIGPNRLFKHLRDEGYIQRVDGSNVPTQRSIDLKVLDVREYTHKKPGGQEIIVRQTRVTGKGHNYFLAKYKKLLDEQNSLLPRRKAGG
jgi:anti-repressor protein